MESSSSTRNNSVNLSKYILEIEERMQRIDTLLQIQNSLHCKDGVLLYSRLAEDVHELRVMVTKMQIIVEDEKKKLKQYQENCSRMKTLDEQVNHMMIFSLQCNPKDDTLPDLNPSNEAVSDADKENKPARLKVQDKRKMGVPSLNPISEDIFQKIPKYMKGRLTLEQLNTGITDVNRILNKKYELFNRRRKELSLKDEKLRSVYLEQGKDLKGTCYSIFFVDDDIQHFSCTLKLKKKTKDSIFLILRHLGRMKEMHKGKLTRYCIMSA